MCTACVPGGAFSTSTCAVMFLPSTVKLTLPVSVELLRASMGASSAGFGAAGSFFLGGALANATPLTSTMNNGSFFIVSPFSPLRPDDVGEPRDIAQHLRHP